MRPYPERENTRLWTSYDDNDLILDMTPTLDTLSMDWFV